MHSSSLIATGRAEVPRELASTAQLAVDLISSERAELAESRRAPELIGQLYGDGAESLIAILGTRGSGKTTLLASICAELMRRTSDIVLPIVRPEVFSSADSLLAVTYVGILERLELTQGRSFSDPILPDNESETGLLLTAARRATFASTDSAFAMLKRASSSVGQFSLEAASLIRQHTQLRSVLTALFDELRHTSSVGRDAIIVVPVDDADLVPRIVTSLLSDLRYLASFPGVVPIICADRDDLHRSVEGSLATELGPGMSRAQLARVARQQLDKTLRPDRILEPPYLDVADRLDFSPIGVDRPLRVVLQSVSDLLNVGVNGPNRLLWDPGRSGSVAAPEGANAWLPITPRGLEHLWYVASSVEADLRRPGGGHHSQWLQRLIDSVAGSSDEVRVRLTVRSSSARRSRSRQISADAVWPQLRLGVGTKSGWHTALDSRRVRIRLRDLARVTGGVRARESSQAAKGDDDLTDLSLSELSAALVVQELTLSPIFSPPGPSSPTGIGVAEFEFLQMISVNGQRTDDQFFFMPVSRGFNRMYSSTIAWNALVRVGHLARRSTSDSTAHAFMRAYLTIVSRYWLGGDARALSLRRLPRLERTMEACAARYVELSNSDDAFTGHTYAAESSYRSWFELLLPQSFHRSFLEKDALEYLIETWSAAIAASRNSRDATAELRDFLDNRFRSLIEDEQRKRLGSHSWIYGYKTLADAVWTELSNDIQLFEEGFEATRGDRALGRELIEETVTLATTRDLSDFPAVKSQEGDAELSLIQDVLEQLRSR